MLIAESSLGRKHTQETIAKIRQANIGKVASEATRLKMSIAPRTDLGLKVVIHDLLKDTVLIENSISKASKAIGLSQVQISRHAGYVVANRYAIAIDYTGVEKPNYNNDVSGHISITEVNKSLTYNFRSKQAAKLWLGCEYSKFKYALNTSTNVVADKAIVPGIYLVKSLIIVNKPILDC